MFEWLADSRFGRNICGQTRWLKGFGWCCLPDSQPANKKPRLRKQAGQFS
jgi:hypothetical protein